MIASAVNLNAPSVANFNSHRIDRAFIIVLLALISVGVVAVATSSIEFALQRYGDEVYFVRKQLIFLMMGISAGCIAVLIPMSVWKKYSLFFFLIGVVALIVVLIPGVGKMVNGSRRWLPLGPFSMQASEMAKLCCLVFFAAYLDRRNEYVRQKWSAFFIMTTIVGGVVLLLLMEPDFGSSVVLCLTLGAMMFVAGVPLLRFLMLAIAGVSAMALIAVLSPYRWERLITFMDPWSHRFDGGYQLVQSLIAFGSGGFTGNGLGHSVQKALFLPEAHTDFIFAVFVEELGFVGGLGLILVVSFFVFKIAHIALQALKAGQNFGGFLCVGIAVMVAVQSFINMGVASGLLPTKGLTFPFVSYGGSSIVITCLLMAMVFRVKWESAVISVSPKEESKSPKKGKKKAKKVEVADEI